MGYGHWINVSTSYTNRPPYGHQDFTNRLHYWDAVYVNDTVISQGYDHNWVTWTQPTPPPPILEGGKFPWYIYWRKRRNII